MERRALSDNEIDGILDALQGWEIRDGKLHKLFKFASLMLRLFIASIRVRRPMALSGAIGFVRGSNFIISESISLSDS